MPPIPLHDHAAMSSLRSRVASVLCVAALAVSVAWADDNWPRFRGAEGGVAADDPRLPDAWGPSQNIVWQIDVPGWSWSSPVVWGDHVFVTTAMNTAEVDKAMAVSAYVARSSGGPMTFKDIAAPSAPHRWVLYDIDFKTGRIRWEREVAKAVPARSRHLKNSYASETPVTDGERVYVYFGHLGLFAFDLEWKAVVVEADARRSKCSPGSGRRSRPSSTTSACTSSTTTKSSRSSPRIDKRTGAELWRVDRKETSNWTTPFVWKNERRTEIVTAGTGGVQSYGVDGKLPVAAHGHVDVCRSEPVFGGRPAIRHVRIHCESSPTGVRDSAWGDRRHLFEAERNQQRIHRLVASHSGAFPSVGAGVPRLLLHPARSRLSDVQRSEDRQRDLSPAAHRNRRDRLHGVPVGVQRQGVRAQ